MLVDNYDARVLQDHHLSRDADDWEIDIIETPGLFVKKMALPAGGISIAHAHAYDHVSSLSRGRALLIAGNEEKLLQPGDCIVIKAGVKHAIKALDDIIWLCIHNVEVALCHGVTR